MKYITDKKKYRQMIKCWNRQQIVHNGIVMTLATLRKLEQMQRDAELHEWLKYA